MRISGNQLVYKDVYSGYIKTQPFVNDGKRLEFRPLLLSDMDVVRHYVNYNHYRTCDYTLGGIFMWVDYFGYEYCVFDDTLFIKGSSENHPGLVAFSLPLGTMPIDRSVVAIMEYCEANNIKPTFSAIPADKVDVVASVCGGKIEKLDGWSNYLYDAKSLASLQGKAYSKKRNHVNRFLIENPAYKFEMITKNNMAEVLDLLSKTDLSEKSDKNIASYELAQCYDVLSNMDKCLFDGALLRTQDGCVCAMTLGEVVGDTLYVHIEKMNHDISGAGETINKLFAAEIIGRYQGVRFINREEDMNDEGLRFAKMSYHPTDLLDKYNVL